MIRRASIVSVGMTIGLYFFPSACAADSARRAPQLVQTTATQETIVVNPHFDWLPVEGAAEYEVQIAEDDHFTHIVDSDTIHAFIDRYVPAEPLKPGSYSWRVRAQFADASFGPWSNVGSIWVVLPKSVFQVPAGAQWKEIRAIVAAAAASSPALVLFAPNARYEIKAEAIGYCLELTNAVDVIIDGQGAVFSLPIEPPIGFARIENSRRMVVRNLTVDYQRPPHLALRVVSIDKKAQRFVVAPLPGYPDWSAEPFQYAAEGGFVKRLDEPGPVKRGSHIKLRTISEQSHPDRGAGYDFKVQNNSELDGLAVGDVYILDKKRGPKIFLLDNNFDTTIYNVTSFGSLSFGYTGTNNEWLKLLRIRQVRKEGWFLSTLSDGIHFREMRTAPWIEGCFLEANGDDMINMRGNFHKFRKTASTDVITVDTGASEIISGARLVFARPFHYLGEARVAAVRAAAKATEVQLTQAIPAHLPTDAVLLSDDYACGQFVFRNNRVRDSRGDGMLLAVHGALIEHNSFESIAENGVALSPAQGGGMESQNVMIRGNRFSGCARYAETESVIGVKFGRTGVIMHKNIFITGNTITSHLENPVVVSNTGKAVVARNAISVNEKR